MVAIEATLVGSKSRNRETEKNGEDLRQINQLDQHLWSWIDTADASLSHKPGETACEAISIFLT
jgi:hypothetical protein